MENSITPITPLQIIPMHEFLEIPEESLHSLTMLERYRKKKPKGKLPPILEFASLSVPANIRKSFTA
jgi:hypothetical protein